jgi:superfamily I DNA and RNA helicase
LGKNGGVLTKSSKGSTKNLVQLVEDLKAALGLDADSVSHISAESASRPSCLIVHPKHGLLAIEFGNKDEKLTDIRIRLNRKVESLRNQLGNSPDLVIQNIVVVADSEAPFESISQTSFVVAEKHLGSMEWTSELKKTQLTKATINGLQARLWPSMAFRVDTYDGTTDRNKNEREASRAILDTEQAKIALTDVSGVMVIAGPPGSGKSLVLAARAKYLAALHPEWKIVLVVYNRMLAKHFRASEDHWPKNIEIIPLKKFLENRGETVLARLSSEYDDRERVLSDATREVDKKKRTGISDDVDALLIDEWQDFLDPFVDYLLSCVHPGRGGAVLAGDKGQAIYTEGLPNKALKGKEVKKVRLERPYRSTRQILDVAQALDGQYVVEGVDHALEGEPVSLIFAATWQLQAEAIAWEINSLVESGDRNPGEIVVLCTTKSGANHVERALDNSGIPNVIHSRIWEDAEISKDAVNVMTVHGGKGFGFKVVFVMGFETLRDLDGTKQRDMWGRVGYVAVTRAEDLLYILYKTQTQFMLNLKKCKKETLVSRNYPDDYKRNRR